MSNIRGTITSYQGAIPGAYPNQVTAAPPSIVPDNGNSIGNQTIDPLICNGTSSHGLGQSMYTRFVPSETMTISNITFLAVVMSDTPDVFLGVYSQTGAQLATTGNVFPLITNPLLTWEYVECPLNTPVTLTANTPYYIALLVTGTGGVDGLRVLHSTPDGSLIFGASYPFGASMPAGTLSGATCGQAAQVALPAQVTGAVAYNNTWVNWFVLT